MMKIYIMRHAEAGYSASSDASRPLTDFGKEQCVAVANWFSEQNISFDLGLVSPYLRAQQSFSIIADVITVKNIETDNALTPGGQALLVADSLLNLSASSDIESVLVVSHLPLVGYLVNELCPHVSPPMFSTANVACVLLSKEGKGTLEWFHHPN